MARACILATNRLVRTRMLGGVGGVPGNRAPIPIFFCYANYVLKDIKYVSAPVALATNQPATVP